MAKQIPVDYYGHNKHLILSYLKPIKLNVTS